MSQENNYEEVRNSDNDIEYGCGAEYGSNGESATVYRKTIND